MCVYVKRVYEPKKSYKAENFRTKFIEFEFCYFFKIILLRKAILLRELKGKIAVTGWSIFKNF